jgi:hypothetical protein
MTNPTIRIHNMETDEIIDREMNLAELAQYKKDQSDGQALKAAESIEAAAKADLLTRLGITAAEADLLLK